VLTVYVGGGDGYLYALRASDGAVMWKSVVGQLPSTTVNDYYNWSSPTVINGVVYDGVSSDCDNPFVPGGVEGFDQTSGARIADYESMPPGTVGGGVWTSVASDGATVWATTGSASPPPAEQGDSYSIVQLDAATLAKQGIWTVPASARAVDADFGASPTLFTANLGGIPTAMVGACDKDGIFYAFKAADVSAGPVWQRPIGKGQGIGGANACLDAAIWDGSRLFIGGNATTINGTAYKGSMRELDPATGNVIWQTGLAANILGSPSIDGAGVIAASTYKTSTGAVNATYLIDAATGTILNTLSHSASFPQPVFVGSQLLVATQKGGVLVYGP
jgi:polyvinyl alcohol dehydrogenase (cytochrome)